MRVFNIPALLDPRAWEYLDEGAANILLRHTTHRSLLLRVRKKPTSLLGFNYHVVSQLIPPQYLGRFGLLEVDRTFLEAIEHQCAPLRPAHRKSKGVNLDQWCAVLLENLSVPHTASIPDNSGEEWIAIEFKPKSALRGRYPVCKWCMQQCYKVARGTRRKVGPYCPLDVFSGDPGRIRQAVEALWWDEESSMKMYVNGHCTARTEDTARLIEVIVHALYKSPVLGVLRSLQKRLDTVSLQSVLALYEDLVSTNELHMGSPEAGTGPFWEDWITAIDKFLVESNSDEEEDILSEPLTTEEKRHIILRFLLSATIKDCSLMITMRKKKNGYGPNGLVNGDADAEFDDRPPIYKQFSLLPTDGITHGFDLPHETSASSTYRVRRRGWNVDKSKSLPTMPAPDGRTDVLEQLFAYFDTATSGASLPWVVHKKSGYNCRIKLIDLDPKSAHAIPAYLQKFTDILDAYDKAPEPKKTRCKP